MLRSLSGPRPLGPGQIEQVSAWLREVGRELILPRFGRLAASDVESKATPGDPTDIVSTVDREVEVWLGERLGSLLAGSVVIGEEAVHADPERLTLLAGERHVWLIDPIDGTRDFVAGRTSFGTMLALVEDGETLASWIALPARRQLFVAERGQGAYRDGVRLRVEATEAGTLPRGHMYTTFMPPALRREAESWRDARYLATVPSCAAVEYTGLAEQTRDFVVYHRLLPWDHAPGVLIAEEAGCSVHHLDGSRYRPTDAGQVTIAAGSRRVAAEIEGWFLGTSTLATDSPRS